MAAVETHATSMGGPYLGAVANDNDGDEAQTGPFGRGRDGNCDSDSGGGHTGERGDETLIISDSEPTSQIVAAPSLTPGAVLGRYVVLEHLGSGGIGDVFTAWDPKLDRKIALKLLKSDAYSQDALGHVNGRMLREAQAMARLAHPNVVSVHDVGVSGAQIFIAMEFVDGVTLKAWLEQGPRDWREIRDVFVQAGEGLLAAHEAGLVHRDFKPSNVLLSADGRVKVLDFGLARSPSANRSGFDVVDSGPQVEDSGGLPDRYGLVDEIITQVGIALGTPAYMAPEQHLGQQVDVRADQFGFCVAAFEAFYGARPFRGRGKDLIRAITGGRITFPEPERSVPGWLRKAILRGLSVHPENRFASMRALLDALQYDRRRKRRRMLSVSLAALLSGGGGAAVVAAVTKPPPAQESQIERLVHEAHEAAARSFFVYPPPEAAETATAYQVVLDLEKRADELGDHAVTAATALRAEFSGTLVGLGDRYWKREGGAPFATDYYAQALVFDPDAPRAAERIVMTPGEIAVLRDKAKDSDFSPAELEAAQMLAVFAQEDSDARDRELAQLYRSKRRRTSLTTSVHVEALLGDKAKHVLQPSERRDDVAERAPSQADPAGTGANGDAQVADPAAEEVVVIDDDAAQRPRPTKNTSAPHDRSEAPVPEPTQPRDRAVSDPAAAKALIEEAELAMRRGAFKAAEALLHRALASDRHNPQVMIALSNLHFQQGKYRDAATFAAQAVQLAPKRADYRIQLGDSYFKVLRYDEARQQYEQAASLGDSRAADRLKRLSAKLGD